MTPDARKKLRELAMAATPGRWHWWTSNSWRRLSTEIDGRAQQDGGVLCPVVARDGHPDLAVREQDAAYIAAAHPGAIIELLDALDAAEKAASESKAGQVLNAVKQVLSRQANWSVEDIKAGVEQAGVKASNKQVYNALGYLTRHGKIKRASYGQYVPA